VVDNSGATAVLHQEHLNVLGVGNVHTVETIIAAEAISAVSTKADAGHLSCSLEATTHGVIDTMGLPPSVTKAEDVIAVVAMETTSGLLGLLHDEYNQTKKTHSGNYKEAKINFFTSPVT